MILFFIILLNWGKCSNSLNSNFLGEYTNMPFPHCRKGLWVSVSVASASFTLDTVKENLKNIYLVHLPKPGVTWKALDRRSPNCKYLLCGEEDDLPVPLLVIFLFSSLQYL